jgi:hypothetical protein
MIDLGINLKRNPRFKTLIKWNWKNSKAKKCNEMEEILEGLIDYLYNFVSSQSIQSN